MPSTNDGPVYPWLTDFKLETVYGAYRYQACRAAVSTPLSNRRPRSRHGVWLAQKLVRKRWASRLMELHAAGWPGLPTWKSVSYAANCPPCDLGVSPCTRVCTRATLCPFCYARHRVLRPFRRLEAALYGPDFAKPDAPLLRGDLAALWFRLRRGFGPDNTAAGLTPALVGSLMAEVKKYAAASRRFERGIFRAEFGTVQFSIYPSSNRPELVLERSGVLLVPRDGAESELAKYLAHFNAKRPPGESQSRVRGGLLPATKKGLAAAFSRAARYPVDLLECDPALAAAALDSLKKFKLVTSFGK